MKCRSRDHEERDSLDRRNTQSEWKNSQILVSPLTVGTHDILSDSFGLVFFIFRDPFFFPPRMR